MCLKLTLENLSFFFFDDILIFSKDLDSHVEHLKKTMQLLRENQLFAKRSKCDFATNQIKYLGHIISSAGVSTNPNKMSAMVCWPVPRSIKELRGFLGLTGYYRKFIRNYGIISKPLSDLLKKDAFRWSETA